MAYRDNGAPRAAARVSITAASDPASPDRGPDRLIEPGSEPGSRLVVAIERAWSAIVRRHTGVPHVVVVVSAAGEVASPERSLGHLAVGRWEAGRPSRPQLVVEAGAAGRTPVELLGMLLHEAAHALGAERGEQDRSRGGRYHNRRFKVIAEELGLVLGQSPSAGWAQVSVPPATSIRYWLELAELGAAFALWPQAISAGARPPTSAGPNLLACQCSCGRRIRVSRRALSQAPIVCGRCRGDFLV